MLTILRIVIIIVIIIIVFGNKTRINHDFVFRIILNYIVNIVYKRLLGLKVIIERSSI
jgi:hypothetical protein